MSEGVWGMNKVRRVYVQGDNVYVQWGRGYFQGDSVCRFGSWYAERVSGYVQGVGVCPRRLVHVQNGKVYVQRM